MHAQMCVTTETDRFDPILHSANAMHQIPAQNNMSKGWHVRRRITSSSGRLISALASMSSFITSVLPMLAAIHTGVRSYVTQYQCNVYHNSIPPHKNQCMHRCASQQKAVLPYLAQCQCDQPDTSTEQNEQRMACTKADHLFVWPVEISFGVDE